MITINDDAKKELAGLQQIMQFKKVLLGSNKDPKDYYRYLLEKGTVFFDWYISYSASILNGKGYSDKKISEMLLKSEFNSRAEEKEFLLKHFLLSKDYVEYLKRVITEVNLRVYFDKLLDLITELEWLISQYEDHCTRSGSGIQPEVSRNIDPTDLHISINNLFDLDHVDTIEQLYLGDVTPAVMFQIRQLFASYGRSVMGYLDITDKHGITLKEFTQVSWNYIGEELKHPNPRISFPLFDLQTYLHINAWAGRFVDTTSSYNSYIQFWALKLIRMLFANGNLAERQPHKKVLLADIKISDYNAFKQDFENYLLSRMPDVKVKWDSIKNVGPLITSN